MIRTLSSHDQLTIGEVAKRSGVATSALRYYEAIGLIDSVRTASNQRRFRRSVIRTVSVIRVAQGLGLALEEIRAALTAVGDAGEPVAADWERMSTVWHAQLEARIAQLEALRDELSECIGCGCLSLTNCALYNRLDKASTKGAGPRYLMGDRASTIMEVE